MEEAQDSYKLGISLYLLTRTFLAKSGQVEDSDYDDEGENNDKDKDNDREAEEEGLSDIEGHVLGAPDMDDVESITSDKHEVESEGGDITIVEGGVSSHEVKKKVLADEQLAEIRKQQKRKFKAIMRRHVRLHLKA